MRNRRKRSLFDALSQLFRCRRGTIAIATVLVMPALIGFIALGVETGLWYAVKRQLQSIADEAAVAGAWELAAKANGYADANFTTLANQALNLNGITGSTTATINSPPSAASGPPYAGATTAVEVILSQPQSLIFAASFIPSVTVGVRAVANWAPNGVACALAYNTVTLQADANLGGCWVVANSSGGSAIAIGSHNLTAQSIWTFGNYSYSGSAPSLNTTPVVYAFVLPDQYAPSVPLIDATEPSLASCSATIPPINPLAPAAPVAVPAGCYSNGMAFTSANPGNYTLCGVYYINGENPTTHAALVINQTAAYSVSTSSCGANGVTFIAYSSTAGSGGGMLIAGSGTVTLSAPGTSPLSGIPSASGLLFYQDPNNADPTINGSSTVTPSNASSLEGAIYAPATTVSYGGNNPGTPCLVLIANNINFVSASSGGGSTLSGTTASCPGTGGVLAPQPYSVSIVE